MSSERSLICRLSLVVGLSLPAYAEGPCPQPRVSPDGGSESLDHLIETDDYSLEISSASGAPGDVVWVTVGLRSQLLEPGFLQMHLAVCHNSRTADLIGEPFYSQEFLDIVNSDNNGDNTDANTANLYFHPVNEDVVTHHSGSGFVFGTSFNRVKYDQRFSAPTDPLPIMTVYYRLKGEPGTSGSLEFCDSSLKYGFERCTYNYILIYTPEYPAGFEYLSIHDSEGVLTIEEKPNIKAPPPIALRGDVNADGTKDISDAIMLLGFLFLGSKVPECPGAGDHDLSGELDLTDAITILNHLFMGGPMPGGETPTYLRCDLPSASP